MSIVTQSKKSAHLKTAIESIEVLINEYNDETLKPVDIYLKQELDKSIKEIERLKSLHIDNYISDL